MSNKGLYQFFLLFLDQTGGMTDMLREFFIRTSSWFTNCQTYSMQISRVPKDVSFLWLQLDGNLCWFFTFPTKEHADATNGSVAEVKCP